MSVLIQALPPDQNNGISDLSVQWYKRVDGNFSDLFTAHIRIGRILLLLSFFYPFHPSNSICQLQTSNCTCTRSEYAKAAHHERSTK